MQDPPDGGAARGVLGVLVDQAGGQLVQAPARGRAALPVREFAGQGKDGSALLGGKRESGGPSGERLADRRAPGRRTASATSPQYDGGSAGRRRCGRW